MDKIEIQGGFPLAGEVAISGAKNSALPIMAAALLAPGKSVIHNIPHLRDVDTMLKIIRALGAKGDFISQNSIEIDATSSLSPIAPYDLVRKMRASVLVLGALLSRNGQARVSLPGGCVIGTRPVGVHLNCLRQLGAHVKLEHGYIHAWGNPIPGGAAHASSSQGSSVGATINSLFAAVGASGPSKIKGAALEPEVIDTIGFLQAMGARIEGAGTSELRVWGSKLTPTQYRIIPDRIEAGTYLLAGALCEGNISLTNVEPSHLSTFLNILNQLGVNFNVDGSRIQVFGNSRPNKINLNTSPYPGFPTDMQAQIMVFLSLAKGESIITEEVFPDRFMHVPELNRMGAKIIVEGGMARINGVDKLSGAPVMASDLRASAALVLAGLVARGSTTINRVYHLDRGYECMEEKLSALGASIRRIQA